MSSTVLNRVNDVEPSLVLFGRDPAGKPRASWFDAGSINFATSAAELMHMKILRIITEEQRALAKQLPRGRIFSSGRAFAPFAQRKSTTRSSSSSARRPMGSPRTGQSAQR